MHRAQNQHTVLSSCVHGKGKTGSKTREDAVLYYVHKYIAV